MSEDEHNDEKDNERGDGARMKRKVYDEPATAIKAKKKKIDDSRGIRQPPI